MVNYNFINNIIIIYYILTIFILKYCRPVNAGAVVEVSEEGGVCRDEAHERSKADLYVSAVPGKLPEHRSTR